MTPAPVVALRAEVAPGGGVDRFCGRSGTVSQRAPPAPERAAGGRLERESEHRSGGDVAVVKRVSRRTLAEQISDALMDAMMDGTVRMGDKLRTQDLADQFGVSRMPVREALINLEANGLVDTTPYAGYRVASLDKGRIRENYVIRRALEPIAARAACERIDATQLARLTVKYEELEEATLSADPSSKQIYVNNRAFHFTLYEASGMPQVVEIIRMAWDRLAVYKLIYTRKYASDTVLAHQMVEEHRAFMDAIAQRDGARLARLLDESIARHEVELPEEFDPAEPTPSS